VADGLIFLAALIVLLALDHRVADRLH